MSEQAWLKASADGVLLEVWIQPSASRSQVVGIHSSPPRLKIRIAAPPVDGKANEELIGFLSKLLDIPKKNFDLLRGHSARQKTLFCRGISILQAQEMLKYP